MSKSIFDVVGQAPDDPILGLNEAFKSDPRDKKVNLSIGVYSTEDGKVPLLRVVAEAEKRILEAGEPHTYLPISGIPAFNAGVQKLIFGADSPIIKEKHAVTVQSLGGTGALKVGADFLAAILKDPESLHRGSQALRADRRRGQDRGLHLGRQGLDADGKADADARPPQRHAV